MNTAAIQVTSPHRYASPRIDVCGECARRVESRLLGPAEPVRNCRLCGIVIDASLAPLANRRSFEEENPLPLFTAADRALIKRLRGYMPAAQLLALLNERLTTDRGEKANLHTLDQLQAELQAQPDTVGAGDWAALRKLLANAQRDGVLAKITDDVLQDFSVVYGLSQARSLRLRDVVLEARAAQEASA
jgi:hypothetical protein